MMTVGNIPLDIAGRYSGSPAMARVVRTIVKGDISRYFRLTLDREDGQPVPAGIYRAYLFGESTDGVEDIDNFIRQNPRTDPYF